MTNSVDRVTLISLFFQELKKQSDLGLHCLHRKLRILIAAIFEPEHEKDIKMTCVPGICPVWSVSLLCTQWVARNPRLLHADSEDSDQTEQMPWLICLRWAHRSFCWFCCAVVHLTISPVEQVMFLLVVKSSVPFQQ